MLRKSRLVQDKFAISLTLQTQAISISLAQYNMFQELNSRELMTLATSGLTGVGVEEGIEWVADTALRNTAIRPPHEATR